MGNGLFRLSSAIALLFLIAGCGGGGGGGGGGFPEVPFTSFMAAQPKHTLVMSGVSQVATGTATGAFGSETIASANLGPVDTASSTLKLGIDKNGNPASISVSTPQSSVAFGKGISCSSGLCDASNSTSEFVGADPVFMGWNYQTFGVWDKAVGASDFQAGAISAGSPTPGSAVPLAGNALFTGIAFGFYVDPGGALFATAATMNANVDFGTRAIGFNTFGTTTSNGGAPVLNTNLNLSGTLNYGIGVNQFSGTVTAPAASLSGSASGRFYGPNAEEIGGVYGLSDTGGGISRMLGGFGGRR